MKVIPLPPTHADAAVSVLCDAFHDYPVMKYVLGDADDYDRRLQTLIGFFVSARVLRNEPVLAVHDGDHPVGVAIVTLPGVVTVPEALVKRRAATWRELGDAERERYEAFGAAAQPFTISEPHHHLNMIGVRRSHAGKGIARLLLDAVHDMAREDAGSSGVSLTTETADNVALYEYFGYRVVGHARVGEDLETWAFFRPNDKA